jgi:hypothetical protein
VRPSIRAATLLAIVTACGGGAGERDSSGVVSGSGASATAGASTGSANAPTYAVAPGVYVDSGACPFECCTYREWQTRAAATLRAAPDSSAPVVATVPAGTKVDAVTGQVHVRPGRFILAHGMRAYSLPPAAPPAPADSFAAGDTLGVYTYRGEGAWKVRRLGSDAPLVELMLAYPGTGCEQNDRCDGRFLEKPESTWWIQIRTRDGVTGWTTDADAFDGKDRCG